MRKEPVLVTGATGYVGNRLVPRLLEAGFRVRACGRSIEKLRSKAWAKHPAVELVTADFFDRDSVMAAAQGCFAAYYFVHSMDGASREFEERDREAALNMVAAAESAHLEQIIYLGGLGEDNQDISKHLKSRNEVAEILPTGQVPVTVLRAAMIIGSGSVSFEILRYLVERLPVMITPRWVTTPNQPIAIKNVLTYLIGCLDNEKTIGQTFDIGGEEILTYRDLMTTYAEEAELPPRKIISVPVFTPRLSSLWIHLVTPVPAYIARPLAEGLRTPVVCQENRIRDIIPQELMTCRAAIKLALDKVQHQQVESHWTDAGLLRHPEWASPEEPHWAGGTVYSDCRRVVVEAQPSDIWKPVVRLGGTTGWYYGNWLWRLRGLMDRVVGGVGLKRGRRHPYELSPGDALDFWRVSSVIPDERLVLVAEMKLPGQAVLEFRIKKLDAARTEVLQIARFLPKGLLGIAYWYAVMPLHNVVFNGMLEGTARASGYKTVEGPKLAAVPQFSSKLSAAGT
ncbi:MAG: SDR family oxidoreductase [Candidatus Obscuribacterales bacterium]